MSTPRALPAPPARLTGEEAAAGDHVQLLGRVWAQTRHRGSQGGDHVQVFGVGAAGPGKGVSRVERHQRRESDVRRGAGARGVYAVEWGGGRCGSCMYVGSHTAAQQCVCVLVTLS